MSQIGFTKTMCPKKGIYAGATSWLEKNMAQHVFFLMAAADNVGLICMLLAKSSFTRKIFMTITFLAISKIFTLGKFASLFIFAFFEAAQAI